MICRNCGNKYPHTIKTWYDKGELIERCNECGGFGLGKLPEFTTQEIKNNRVKYFNSIVQPYRNGELSKEYVDAHGTKGINATEKEIRNARDVWKDTEGYSTRKKSL